MLVDYTNEYYKFSSQNNPQFQQKAINPILDEIRIFYQKNKIDIPKLKRSVNTCRYEMKIKLNFLNYLKIKAKEKLEKALKKIQTGAFEEAIESLIFQINREKENNRREMIIKLKDLKKGLEE